MKKIGFLLAVLMLLASVIACKQTAKENNEKQEVVVKGKEEKQILQLTEKINEDPKNAELYFQRSKLYISIKDIDKAHVDIQKAISIDTTKSKYYLVLGDVNYIKSKIGNAKKAFEKSISIDENNIEAYLKLAELNFLIKDYKQVKNLTDKILLKDKNNALAYYIRAKSAKEMGDTLKAIQYFQKSVYLNPKHYESFIELGLIFASKNDPTALQYYSSALEISPNSPEALYNTGVFYQEHGDFNKAAEVYNLAIKVKAEGKYAPFTDMALYNLGLLHYKNYKDFKKAIQFFDELVKRNDQYIEAVYMRGLCHEQLKDYKNARADYQKALEMKENYDKAIAGLNRLDSK